ncbi:MAG: hypothetical protein LBS89_02220 [Zoogloeaceae bacterium]|nr:hypothetical protein [Zoogloeaceae bacterium]
MFPRIIRHLAGLIAFCAATAVWSGAPIPSPEFDLDPEMMAKLLRERANQQAANGGATVDSSVTSVTDSNPCGNVIINSNNQSNSNSGIRDMFGKESVTIITGPVINAANCK